MTVVVGEDSLLGMLFPFWRVVIGLCVVLAVVVAAVRLARRGQSRMRTALLVLGTAIVALTFIRLLIEAH